MAIDKVVSASITDGTITSSDLASGAVQNQSAFKNIVINGDMRLAQRATSASSLTSSGYHTLDRYISVIDGAGTWTQSRSTTAPTDQGFDTSLKMDCTTADGSLAATDMLVVQQRFEGQMLQYLKKGTSNAESLTASFWVRSNKTGTYICELRDINNTRYISKSYTISSADTWEKKELTYAGDTTGELGNNNSASLYLTFWLAAGSNFSSGTLGTSWHTTGANRAVGQVNLADSTSNEWYITGIQLEAGTVATDFEHLPLDVTTTRCQRYYQKSYDLDTAPGTATDVGVYWTGSTSDSSGNASFLPSYKTTLRSSPTLTGYARDGTSGEGSYFRNGASGNGTLNSHMRGQMSSSVYINIGANYTAGTVASHVTLDSEL
tara:strand:- start:153 stop:1286 length:1134 start_codon:yes stop_codon:yes gene_type:complete